MPEREKRELKIPADARHLPEVRRFVDEAARVAGLPPRERFDVTLAVHEAVINAIEHGSDHPEDDVCVRASVDDQALRFTVSDSGTPEEWRRRSEDLSERGRGLVFVRGLMDCVEFGRAGRGTRVSLGKRLAL